MPEQESQFVPEEHRENVSQEEEYPQLDGEHRYSLEEIQDLYQESARENVPVSEIQKQIDQEDPFLQLGRYSGDISPEFEEKIGRLNRDVPLPEYVLNVIKTIEGEFDPEKVKIRTPESFDESRFISARGIWEKRQESCGSLSTLVAAALRREFIPTKLIHGFIQGQKDEDRHAWIEVYFPSVKKWVPLDITNQGNYRITPDHVKMKEYVDWGELERDYREGNF